jgi:HupE / UreJ protein
MLRLRMRPAPWILAAALALVLPVPSRAHDFAFTEVRLVLARDATFRADVRCDVDALALGVDSSADSKALAARIEGLPAAEREALVAGLEQLLKRRLRVRFDGKPAPFDVSLPDRGQPVPPGTAPSALGLTARISGVVPPGAQTVEFFASRGFPPVHLVVESETTGAAATEVLEQGGTSRPVPLAGRPEPSSRGETARRFLRLGFEHILPLGVDHVLFVLGLALLSPRAMTLTAQVTAFTVAHTATLALSTYGLLRLPSRVVEPLIALSIVYVAVENLLTDRLRPWRIALVFAFGLLHGLGFAGALEALGLPEGERPVALLSFNVGVELGQLAVVLPAWGLLALATRRGISRARIVRPVSVLIGAAGLYWAITRAFG